MSVMKEAFATALPSRIKSFARNCVFVSLRNSSSVSKFEPSQLGCTCKSWFSFPCCNVVSRFEMGKQEFKMAAQGRTADYILWTKLLLLPKFSYSRKNHHPEDYRNMEMGDNPNRVYWDYNQPQAGKTKLWERDPLRAQLVIISKWNKILIIT